MNKIAIPLILVSLIMISTVNCYDCTISSSNGIELGSSAIICLHFVFNETTTPIIKTYAFKTTVDKFSALKVNGLSGLLKNNTAAPISVVIQAQNSSQTTKMTVFHPTQAGGIQRNIYSFVVNIKDGNVESISDDNADCGNCDITTQACSAQTDMKCYNKGTAYNLGDPRFFISWVGTDIKNAYMLSHTKRLSRFTQYSIGSIYSKIVQTFK